MKIGSDLKKNLESKFKSKLGSKKILATLAAILTLNSIVTAENVPAELNADSVEYDMHSETLTADGNVVLTQGTDRATADHGVYNFKTQSATLTGNVVAVRDNTRITCERVISTGDHMIASGNVFATQDDKTFRGEQIDYYPNDRKHIVIDTGGVVTSVDGTFSADHLEGWIDEGHYIGTGNAHLSSPPRELEAGGDRIDYYTTDPNARFLSVADQSKSRGIVIVEGNAWANQKGNALKGNRLTLHVADNGGQNESSRGKFDQNLQTASSRQQSFSER